MKNMQKSLVRNGLVLGIIVLFVGVSVVPSISSDIKKISAGKNRDIIYVNWDGTGDYTTIQEGVDAANNGDTIFVYSGTYYENVGVYKSINLIGEDRNNTIIDGSGSGDVIYGNTNNITVKSFTIQNGGSASTDCCIELEQSSGSKITNNILINTYTGIHLYDSDGSIIDSNSVSDNTYGITVEYSDNTMLSRNSAFSNTNCWGISIGYSSGNIVINNTVSDNSDGFELISYCTDSIFFGNTILNNSNNGMYVYKSSNNVFFHNNFIDNTNQVCISSSVNTWDNGYPSGGNYWSDFDEPSEGAYDNFIGPNQDIPDEDGDGIVDLGLPSGGLNPYIISGDSEQDMYPLIEPWGSGGPQPFYFVHISDTHIGQSGAYDILENAVQKINDFEPPPAFVVVSGDLVEWGCGLIGWSNFLYFIDAMDNLDQNIPYYTCPGNHDSRWGCGTDKYQWLIRDELRYTEFINNNLKLISMNSGYDESAFGCWSLENPFNIDWYPEGSGISVEDYNWLKNQLTTQSNFKAIMFEHHPIVSYQSDWSCNEKEDNGWNACIWNNRVEVWDLLKDPNEDGNNDDAVKVVLNGHMHYNVNFKSDTPYNPKPIACQSNGYLSTTDPKYEDYLPLHITTGSVCESEYYRLIWVGAENEIQISEMQKFNEKIRCTAWWAPILPIFNNNTIGPSGRIHVYDSNGNHIGINETGQLDFEIEGSFYSDKTMYNESEDVNYTVGEVISVLFNEQNYTYVYEAIEDSILNIETEFPIGTIGSTIVEHSHINAISGSIGKLFVDKDSIDYTLYWDDDGDGIVDREIEPAAIINPPMTPSTPSGPPSGKAGTEYTYSTSTTDSEDDQIYYLFYWGDGTDSGWLGPYDSGDICQASHIWEERGNYQIEVLAKDIYGSVGYWSDPFIITIVENDPPSAPVITGTINGAAGTSYDYDFTAIDPDGDDVQYYIDWGDGETEWTSFAASNTPVTVSHTWVEQDDYVITAKAKDEYGLEGPEATMSVSMPRNRAVNRPFFNFLENHPNLFPILRPFFLSFFLFIFNFVFLFPFFVSNYKSMDFEWRQAGKHRILNGIGKIECFAEDLSL